MGIRASVESWCNLTGKARVRHLAHNEPRFPSSRVERRRKYCVFQISFPCEEHEVRTAFILDAEIIGEAQELHSCFVRASSQVGYRAMKRNRLIAPSFAFLLLTDDHSRYRLAIDEEPKHRLGAD